MISSSSSLKFYAAKDRTFYEFLFWTITLGLCIWSWCSSNAHPDAAVRTATLSLGAFFTVISLCASAGAASAFAGYLPQLQIESNQIRYRGDLGIPLTRRFLEISEFVHERGFERIDDRYGRSMDFLRISFLSSKGLETIRIPQSKLRDSIQDILSQSSALFAE